VFDAPAGKRIFYCRGEAKEKNARKIPGLLHRGASAETWARCRADFTSRGRRVEASQLLKGRSENV
jgi:hypothetical protein